MSSRPAQWFADAADREVILAAGAFNSPQLLLLSGIGPADELRQHGIAVVRHLPGVGRNLQDHLDLLLQYRCLEPVSWNPATTPLGRLKVGLEWLLLKRGIGASNIWETGSFFKSRPDAPYPNLQHHFAPVAINFDGSGRIAGHGFQVHISQMRPRSRGSVTLRSADPLAAPRLRFNHLEDAEDRQEIRDGIRITRRLIGQKAFDRYRGDEIMPGGGQDDRRRPRRLRTGKRSRPRITRVVRAAWVSTIWRSSMGTVGCTASSGCG